MSQPEGTHAIDDGASTILDDVAVLNHLFLPRRLPTHAAPVDKPTAAGGAGGGRHDKAKHGSGLVPGDFDARFPAVVRRFLAENGVGAGTGDCGSDKSGVVLDVLPSGVARMLDVWQQNYHLADGRQLMQLWQGVEVDAGRASSAETVVVHVYAQNSVLTFTTADAAHSGVDDDIVIVRCYDVQPRCTAVTSRGHGNDPRSACPSATARVRRSRLVVAEVAEQVAVMQRTPFHDAFPLACRARNGAQPPNLHDPRELRDAPHSGYVRDWLLSVLCASSGEDGRGGVSGDEVYLRKKYRDRVMFSRKGHEACDQPWRRSPAWMSLKMVLHHTLVLRLGARRGTVVYKLCVLRFLLACLPTTTATPSMMSSSHARTTAIDRDLCVQMLAKLSGRVHKLERLWHHRADQNRDRGDNGGGSGDLLGRAVLLALDDASERIRRVNDRLTAIWHDVVRSEDDDRRRLATAAEVIATAVTDVSTTLPLDSSVAYLSDAMTPRQQPDGTDGRRHVKMGGHADKNMILRGYLDDDATMSDSLFGLFDFDRYVLCKWGVRGAKAGLNCDNLRRILEAYWRTAGMLNAFSRDRVSYSRVLLVSYVIMMQSDRVACSECRSVRQHPSGVQTGVLARLLTTSSDELLALQEVRKYFSERNRKGSGCDPPLTADVSEKSLSVTYSKTNFAMQSELERLVGIDEMRRRRQLTEVEQEIDDVGRRVAELKQACTCPEHGSRDCDSCRQRGQHEESSRHVLEMTMPRGDAERHAVVFELNPPNTIRSWRDTLIVFNALVLESFHEPHRTGAFTTVGWWQARVRDAGKVGSGVLCTLGFTRGGTGQHYTTRQVRLLGSEPTDFVVDCSANCVLSLKRTHPLIVTIASCRAVPTVEDVTATVGTACVLQLEAHESPSMTSSLEQLQRWVGTCDHQQSDVIAAQSTRPPFLSAAEFVAFGSLRAGERLQWHNVLRALHQRLLPLHRTEVAILLAQTLWQSGSSDRSLGAAHGPCAGPVFVGAMVDELRSTLDGTRANWQNHWALCSVVIIANRLLDLHKVVQRPSDTVSDEVTRLRLVLLDCRLIAAAWIRSLLPMLQGDGGDVGGDHGDARCQDDNRNGADLQRTLVDVATFGALSFQCEVDLAVGAERLGVEQGPLFHWLLFTTTSHRYQSQVIASSKPSAFRQTLRNMVLELAARRSEDIGDLVEAGSDDGCDADIVRFLRSTLGHGCASHVLVHRKGGLWVELHWGEPPELVRTGSASCYSFVQINVLEGKLFVDGRPPDRLPESVTEHYLFRRHFGAFNFQAAPCVLPDGRAGLKATYVPGNVPSNAAGRSANGTTQHSQLEFVFIESIAVASSTRHRYAPSSESDSDADGDGRGFGHDFEAADKPEALAIYERRPCGQLLRLLHPAHFRSPESSRGNGHVGYGGYDIPRHFLLEHSMWLNEKLGKVHFRPIDFRHKSFPDLGTSPLVLDWQGRKLRSTGESLAGGAPSVGKATLLSPSCRSGRELLALFSLLELPCHVEMWRVRTKDGSALRVRLPRLHLSFERTSARDGVGELNSLDHRDFVVDVDQTLGTLHGLRHGLVLVKARGTPLEQRCLILPHAAKITIGSPDDKDNASGASPSRRPASSLSKRTAPRQQRSSHLSRPATAPLHPFAQSQSGDEKDPVIRRRHHHVALDLAHLLEPPCFRLDHEPVLRRLRPPASIAAWYYLAALHASTSSPHCDQLTGITGMESAITILRSGLSWSSRPLDANSAHWLEWIATLSPRRRYYPHGKPAMEGVRWPAHLSSLCTHDAYRLLVARILEHSRRLDFMFNDDAEERDGVKQHCDSSASSVDWREFRPSKKNSVCTRSLYEKAYHSSVACYPLMARLPAEHFGGCAARHDDNDDDKDDGDEEEKEEEIVHDDDDEKQALFMWKPTCGTAGQVFTAVRALCRAAPVDRAPPVEELLRALTETTTTTARNDGGKNSVSSSSTLFVQESCQFWYAIDIRHHFFSLCRWVEGEVIARGTKSPLLSLLLSFLLYRERPGEGEAENGGFLLVKCLVSLASARPVPLPKQTSFPKDEVRVKVDPMDFVPVIEFHMDGPTTRQLEHLKQAAKRDEEVGKALLEKYVYEYGGAPTVVLCSRTATDKQLPTFSKFQPKNLRSQHFDDAAYKAAFSSTLQSANTRHVLRHFAELVIHTIGQAQPVHTSSVNTERVNFEDLSVPEMTLEYPRTPLPAVSVRGDLTAISTTSTTTSEMSQHSAGAAAAAAAATAVANASHLTAFRKQECQLSELLERIQNLDGDSAADHDTSVAQHFACKLRRSLDVLQRDNKESGRASTQSHTAALPSEAKQRRLTELEQGLERARRRVDELWERLQSVVAEERRGRTGTTLFGCRGTLTRCHPHSMYSMLLLADGNATCSKTAPLAECFSGLRTLVLEIAVHTVKMQRCRRMLLHFSADNRDLYEKDLCNPPHLNWSPESNVSWLLFELENDLCVRTRQMDVARHMLAEHVDSQHSVTQLNMGEGKTKVIVPLLLLAMADGHTLARLIVLTPLLRMNFNQLVFQLGSLLGRRLVLLPFQRTQLLHSAQVARLLDVVHRCREDGNPVVMVREHILSLRLKLYESAYSSTVGERRPRTQPDGAATSTGVAKLLYELIGCLDSPTRDIVDECDEVLHHRFQLVYPIGLQQDPDGRHLRWEIAEYCLYLVQEHAPRLQRSYGTETILIDDDVIGSHKFRKVRFLDSHRCSAAAADLYGVIFSDVFSNQRHANATNHNHGATPPSFCTELRKHVTDKADRLLVKRFLTEAELLQNTVESVKSLGLSENCLTSLLCLRGLLAHDVLLFCLQRRHRVDYGLVPPPTVASSDGEARGKHGSRAAGNHPSRHTRHIRLAVPYRAKDVPAANTEFGHPDIAVTMTLLSYYATGLSAAQVMQLLERLERKPARHHIYESWVKAAGNDAPDGIRDYEAINRHDAAQMCGVVCPFLRRHTMAVDFFLNHVIFPAELKVFPEKLVANAWSLVACASMAGNGGAVAPVVSGFSGTNDTELLLPGAGMRQQDLDALVSTNAHVCNLVLRNENDSYESFPAGIGAFQLLKLILCHRNAINTIIDVGACVLDRSNEDLARQWLTESPPESTEAVVYFHGDEPHVLDRRGSPGLLRLSPYVRDLSRCLVYIDHAHTRGTDLPMTAGSRAAVTLGKGLPRDALVQACMRMRRLGYGHSLVFWSPSDVDAQIRHHMAGAVSQVAGNLARDQPGGRAGQVHHRDILYWSVVNSVRAIENGLYHWATQGLHYRRLAEAERRARRHAARGNLDDAIRALGKGCAERDAASLSDLYGNERRMASVADILARNKRTQLAADGPEARFIVKQCRHYGHSSRRFEQRLDEEQERELEQELEEERQDERPPRATAVVETLPDYLIDVVSSGDFNRAVGDCKSLWRGLKSTRLVRGCEQAIARRLTAHSLCATRSFRNTVRLTSSSTCDQYLRPVEWLLCIGGGGADDGGTRNSEVILAISPFQANELLSEFARGVSEDGERQQWHPNVTLRPFASCVRRGQSILARTQLASPRLHYVTSCPDQGHQVPRPTNALLLAELFCYSAGLYFPEHSRAMVAELLAILGLRSTVAERRGETVATMAAGGADVESGRHGANELSPLLVKLYETLRDPDSLDVSDMGDVLFRRLLPGQQRPPSILSHRLNTRPGDRGAGKNAGACKTAEVSSSDADTGHAVVHRIPSSNDDDDEVIVGSASSRSGSSSRCHDYGCAKRRKRK